MAMVQRSRKSMGQKEEERKGQKEEEEVSFVKYKSLFNFNHHDGDQDWQPLDSSTN